MRRHRRHGQSLVELVIVLPLFLLLISAIIDFGRIFHIWSCLNLQCIEAAREGAKRRNQLLGRNIFDADTHTAPASITHAFFLHQSPAIDPGRYRTPSGEQATSPELIGVGTGDREITVKMAYSIPLLTPFIDRLFLQLTGKSHILVTAAATERKE